MVQPLRRPVSRTRDLPARPGLGRPVLRRALGADPDEVAPPAGRRRRGRERAASRRRPDRPGTPCRPPPSPRRAPRPTQVSGQRLGRVLVADHLVARQVVQLDLDARAAEGPGRRQGVERQRQRAADVEHGQRPPAGLVVDDHQLAAAVRAEPVVEPVDPAGQREHLGAGRHRPLDAQRLVVAGPAARRTARPSRGPGRARATTGSSSRKPSRSQAFSSSRPAATAERRAGSSRQKPASARCTLAPRLLCAHGGPFGGAGRSR